MRSNLLSGLRHLLPAAEAEATAYGITSLIDGLWLRLGLEQGGIDRDLARQQVLRYLDMSLAQAGSTASSTAGPTASLPPEAQT